MIIHDSKEYLKDVFIKCVSKQIQKDLKIQQLIRAGIVTSPQAGTQNEGQIKYPINVGELFSHRLRWRP